MYREVKVMKKLIIYLLLSIGFVVMIMPFAWMIVTSFKLPSEVQQWPPKWVSKNFFSTRQVKVETKIGALRTLKGISLSEALSFTSSKDDDQNVLNISVEDDPFYRGKMTLDITGYDYIEKASMDNFSKWIKSLKFPQQFSTESPEKFFEEVFLFYYSGNSPYFKRLNYISNLEAKINNAISGIELVSKFVERRVSDKNEQTRFKDFLNKATENLITLKEDILKYKAGKSLVLTNDEINELYKLLDSINLVYGGKNELTNIYSTKVVNVISQEKDYIEFYLEVYKYFKRLQVKRIDKPIIAKVMTKNERMALLKENLKRLPESEILNNLIVSEDFDNLPEKFSKKIDSYFLNEYKIETSFLNNLKSLVVTYKNLLIERGVDYEQILKNGSFDDLIDISDKILSDSSSYKIFKAKVESISYELENYKSFLKELILLTDHLDLVRKVYNNSMNSWKIIDAPEFVKAVRVRNGEVIEIELNGIAPIYLSDDNLSTINLSFTFGEIIKNIFQNYVDAWKAAPFGQYYINTVFVATATTVLEVILASMAAYAFSWMNFPGKNALFGLFLATMMVPGEVLLVPNFITISKFGWIDTYYSLIIPWIVSVFAIFLMRQHFLSIPKELFDASKIDGCSHWRFLWQIVVPLSKPVIITGALLKFVGSWNSFLWVLIVTNSDKYRTLPVGLQNFSSDVGTLYNQLMAAATFSVLPVIILFLFTQKYFIKGIARTGLK
jgi:multiple sugar transport system permease protein